MRLNSFERRLTAWIAAIAILMAALAPSISHALATSGKGLAWADICSVIDSKSAGSASPMQKDMHFEHCPFCVTHASSFGLPPSSGAIVLPIMQGTHHLPQLFYHAPRPLFAWAAAQPRAPPVVS